VLPPEISGGPINRQKQTSKKIKPVKNNPVPFKQNFKIPFALGEEIANIVFTTGPGRRRSC